MAGFSLRGHLLGAQNPVTVDLIIGNSVTVTVGDMVYMDDGTARLCTSSTDILGVVAGIIDANGIDLDSTSSDNYDGTWTSSSQTYVAASDNATDKKVKVKVIADPNALFYNDSDGNFTDPTDLLRMANLLNENQVDESTADEEDVGQLLVWKLDPDGDADASKGLFKIARWQGDAWEPET